MAQAFDREALLDAFDRIGHAAAAAKTRLQIAVYGGSALMLASNFRFATEDVDIAEIGGDWPDWLKNVVAEIAQDRGWGDDWFNDSVAFHLSPLADRSSDHLEFGTFPRDASEPGLVVSVPTVEYLLAMKLKAMRILDQKKGDAERLDLVNLLKVANVTTIDEAIAVLGRYFPASAASSEKQRFLLKNMKWEEVSMRPATLAEAVERIVAGTPVDKAISEFVDTFDLTQTKSARYARIEAEPVLTADEELNAFVGGVAEYLSKQRKLGLVPGWAASPCRRLAQPHFIPNVESSAMREYLTFSSPAEFASRNIFTEERPLRRARGPAVGKPDLV